MECRAPSACYQISELLFKVMFLLNALWHESSVWCVHFQTISSNCMHEQAQVRHACMGLAAAWFVFLRLLRCACAAYISNFSPSFNYHSQPICSFYTMVFAKCKEILSWLYFQYLLHTGLLVVEPCERISISFLFF